MFGSKLGWTLQKAFPDSSQVYLMCYYTARDLELIHMDTATIFHQVRLRPFGVVHHFLKVRPLLSVLTWLKKLLLNTKSFCFGKEGRKEKDFIRFSARFKFLCVIQHQGHYLH